MVEKEKKSFLDLSTGSITVVLFLFMMVISGGVYRLINYKDIDTSLLKELAVVVSSILISFLIALVLKRVKKGKEIQNS